MKARRNKIKAHKDWSPQEAKQMKKDLTSLKVNLARIEGRYRYVENKKKLAEKQMKELIKHRTEQEIRINAVKAKLLMGEWFK